MRKLLVYGKKVFIIQILLTTIVFLNMYGMAYAAINIMIPSDGLDAESLQITFNNAIDSKYFNKIIDGITNEYELQYEIAYKIKGIYCTQDKDIELLEGRFFTNDDYTTGGNVVILSEEYMNQNPEIYHNKIYTYANKKFDVIGVFKQSDNKINEDCNCYINMFAENIIGKYDKAKRFFLRSHDTELIKKGDAFREQAFIGEYTISELVPKTFFGFLKILFEEQVATFVFLAVMLLLIVLNQTNIISQWIHSRKKEQRVMYMCGADERIIKNEVYKQYCMLVIIGIIIAFPISLLLACFEWSIFKGITVNMVAIVVSVVCCIMLSVWGILVIHFNYRVKEQ